MTTTHATDQTAKKLAQQRKYVNKEPKSINMSHEAYLLFRRIAQERHLGVGDLFEVLMQEEAQRQLTQPERLRIRQEADRIRQKRQATVDELERTLPAS